MGIIDGIKFDESAQSKKMQFLIGQTNFFILWPLLDIIINDMILRFVNSSTCSNTVVYWLIAVATITLSKQKGTATKQGWLL